MLSERQLEKWLHLKALSIRRRIMQIWATCDSKLLNEQISKINKTLFLGCMSKSAPMAAIKLHFGLKLIN